MIMEDIKEKHRMTVARATKEEIDAVNNFLNEIASLARYFGDQHQINAIKENKDDFPVLSRFDLENNGTFLDDICQHLNNIRYEVVIFNLVTLMDNCADLKADTLEFNDDITKGLELLEKQKDNCNCSEQFPKPISPTEYECFNCGKFVTNKQG